MRLIAKDSFYSDETKQVVAKQEFTVESVEVGRDLIKRGLAEESTKMGDANQKPAAKPATSSKGKSATTPQNKAISAAPKNK